MEFEKPSVYSNAGQTSGAARDIESHLNMYEHIVENSYANNSRLYLALEKTANIDEITDFLCWDAVQPPFTEYLGHWVRRVPKFLRQSLLEHLEIEEREQHSQYFKEMMQLLARYTGRGDARPKNGPLDHETLDTLNYTFSARCAHEQNSAFFSGGFFATELMSAKRCAQLFNGLVRNGIPGEQLTYLKIHFGADSHHALEVRNEFLRPLLKDDLTCGLSILNGISDRLRRSAQYLMWYERNRDIKSLRGLH